ncbi:MAG: HAMP domain-containing histidine kinase [Oscillospiraceae bacterium]|nr:HAMP domain-containing histidine kinase [Oscillospiraceae bacterium]
MLISKRALDRISADILRVIAGESVDFRNNREGALSALRNDIHTLARLKNEQVEALVRDKAVLRDTLADISHQLKTPLTSMMIMAELLESAPPEKHTEFIENIKSGLARTQWLVTAMLKLAKLDSGAVEFSRAMVSSGKVIGRALEPLGILLELKNQRVERAGEAELFCDLRWTAEALSNILKNASEYSPTESVIRVGAGENPICAWISVADRGKGLTREELSSVFKRFEGSRADAGYGIGLPMALSIMRGQNGDVSAENAEGGAVFTLKFYK